MNDDLDDPDDAETQAALEEMNKDPWQGASASEVIGVIDAALTEAPDGQARTGLVLVPSGEVSVRTALLSVIARDDEAQEAAEVFLENWGIGEVLHRITAADLGFVVWCSVSSSMVSGAWGLMEFRVGDRGYLYYQADWGIDDDESLSILGAWEPADDAEARRACVLRTYQREWFKRHLPPLMGEWARGDAEILQTAIHQVLEDNDDAWEWVFGRLRDCQELLEPTSALLEEASRLSGAPSDRVREVLRAVQPLDKGSAPPREEAARRIVVALFIRCIAKEPALTRER